MKHAFLIIAHNEFEILQELINQLDDRRNDIYIHIDRKVKHLPILHSNFSRLIVLKHRVDVRWGNISQIKTEFLLFKTAFENGPYFFYHLISGTHLPVKDCDYIFSFFEKHSEKNIFCGIERRKGDYQEILKIHRINIFTRGFASRNRLISKSSQFLWKSFIALQRILGIQINKDLKCYWASNWCSLSQCAVEYLIENENFITKKYRWTFCGDEWFVPTELIASPLADTVINCNELLFSHIKKANAENLTIEDYSNLQKSEYLFARKFSSEIMNDISQ